MKIESVDNVTGRETSLFVYTPEVLLEYGGCYVLTIRIENVWSAFAARREPRPLDVRLARSD